MTGVEVHAQLFESMLTGNLLRRPATLDLIEVALVLTFGLLTIFRRCHTVDRRSPIALVLGTAVLCSLASLRASGSSPCSSADFSHSFGC